MKTYTTGEVFRLGLLKNRHGQPYKDKGMVSKELKKFLPVVPIKDTPHGPARVFTEKQIDTINKRWGIKSTK